MAGYDDDDDRSQEGCDGSKERASRPKWLRYG